MDVQRLRIGTEMRAWPTVSRIGGSRAAMGRLGTETVFNMNWMGNETAWSHGEAHHV
jgi:hypothetical protein